VHLLGSVLAVSLLTLACPADAARLSQNSADTPAKATLRHVALRPIADNTPVGLHRLTFIKQAADNTRLGAGSKLTKNGKARVYAVRYAGGLQCVPFARAASGIELKGNAVNWWDAAAGVYERGSQPEAGAVLNFRANGGMRLGHVAVVRQVVNSREIEIDHANWAWSGKGNISRGVAVVDVSERNDWTAVRVALGNGSEFGSIYSTYGFIYDRPERGTLEASFRPAANAPSRDLRADDEVAEAPGGGASTGDDAPERSVR
jgi:surface antigen